MLLLRVLGKHRMLQYVGRFLIKCIIIFLRPESLILSVGEQSEYSMYHANYVRFNPVSSTASSPTRVVLFDDFGNTKTIDISYN